MRERGWTVRGLAVELDVSRSTVEAWRAGKYPIPHLAEIALNGPPLADRTPPPPGTGGD